VVNVVKQLPMGGIQSFITGTHHAVVVQPYSPYGLTLLSESRLSTRIVSEIFLTRFTRESHSSRLFIDSRRRSVAGGENVNDLGTPACGERDILSRPASILFMISRTTTSLSAFGDCPALHSPWCRSARTFGYYRNPAAPAVGLPSADRG